MATRAIDRSTDRPIDSIPNPFGPGPLQALMWPTGSYASLGITISARIRKPPGDVPPGDTHDRPIERTTDRPIDRSTDLSVDRSTDRPIDRFDSIPHFGPGPLQALV